MGFVLDDHYVVAQNPVIKNPSLYPRILTANLFAANRMPESKLNYYRPFLAASLAFDYRIWGLNTFGYRMVNVLLHAFNSILVFILFLLLFKNRDMAVLASLGFCVLPVHEWVVRYIVGRGDLLEALFSLLSFNALLLYLKGSRNRYLALSLAASAAALLCREVALLNTAYVFLISYAWSRDLKKALRISFLFLILALVYYSARVLAFPIAGPGLGFSLASGAGSGIALAVQYVLHFLCPALILAASVKGYWLAALLAACFLGLIFLKLRESKNFPEDALLVGLGTIWIGLVVVPIAVTQKLIDRLGPVLSEHFLYFSSIGFALLWAFILDRTQNGFVRRLLFVISMVYFLGVGIMNGSFWQNEERLLSHVRRLEGKEFTVADEQIAMRFSGDEIKVKQLVGRASSDYARSLWLKRLGNIYRLRGDYPNAIKSFQEAVRTNPSNVEALNELGVSYWETGDIPSGFASLVQSLKEDPLSADTYRLLGTAYYRQGRFLQAIEMFRQAFAYDPDQAEISLYLMMAYFFAGDQEGYLNMLEQTSRRFGQDRLSLKFAAVELFNHGYFAETVKIFSEAGVLFKDDPQAWVLFEEARRRVVSQRLDTK